MNIRFIRIHRLYFLLLSVLAINLFFIGCSEDDDTPGANPVAGFTYTADELTVTFTNTSTDADSYSWEFGDGNSSTTASPVHTYAAEGTYNVALTASNGSMSDQETMSIMVTLDPENARLQSGYVVVGITDDDSYFAQYFEEMPTGTVDITQGTAFQSFFPLSVNHGALFMTRTDGSAGFTKIGVNGNMEFVEDGIISTVSPESFSLRVKDAEFGVFHDRNDPNVLNTFNPTTMAVTGTIDMTAANALSPDPVRYQTYIFRGDDEIFVPTRLEAGGNIPDIQLPKVGISGGSVSSVAQFEGLGDMLVFNRFGQRFVDETGNLYFFHGGDLGLPTVSGAIVKIPAGSDDYDPDYHFKVPEVNNPALIGQGSFLSTFYYYQNDIGFALINEELDQRILDLVIERGGTQNLTDDDFNQILFWMFTSPTGAWVQVDLVNQTVANIDGLPSLSPFDASNMAFIGGVPHFAIANPSVNAFYKLNETTGAAEKVFDMTGAAIQSVYDLSIDE